MLTDVLCPPWCRADGVVAGRVGAVSTTRSGGVSKPPFDSLNLGQHVGDAPTAVASNRARFSALLPVDMPLLWLDQVHGARVAEADEWQPGIAADALLLRTPGKAAVVMTADCLPILLTTLEGTVVAAVHAGWRGLAAGIVGATVARMGVAPGAVLAWIGPAISQAAFEVGDEVRAAFTDRHAGDAAHFAHNPRGRWQADLPGLALAALRREGVHDVSVAGLCTAGAPARFFSHRRSAPTGRMATAIWLKAA
ncbi:MAG: peptidoglycan editing factor PgeF [Pseudomonadota bacterium]